MDSESAYLRARQKVVIQAVSSGIVRHNAVEDLLASGLLSRDSLRSPVIAASIQLQNQSCLHEVSWEESLRGGSGASIASTQRGNRSSGAGSAANGRNAALKPPVHRSGSALSSKASGSSNSQWHSQRSCKQQPPLASRPPHSSNQQGARTHTCYASNRIGEAGGSASGASSTWLLPLPPQPSPLPEFGPPHGTDSTEQRCKASESWQLKRESSGSDWRAVSTAASSAVHWNGHPAGIDTAAAQYAAHIAYCGRFRAARNCHSPAAERGSVHGSLLPVAHVAVAAGDGTSAAVPIGSPAHTHALKAGWGLGDVKSGTLVYQLACRPGAETRHYNMRCVASTLCRV